MFRYRWVCLMSACPSISWIVRMSIPAAATVTLEESTSLLREHDGVVPTPDHPNRLDEALLAQVSKVPGPRVGTAAVVVAKVTTGDHSKGSNGRERARL